MSSGQTIPVFRKGEWIHYPFPTSLDVNWSHCHLLRAASFYATALSQGYTHNESRVLADCFLNKEVYPDLQYGRQIERKLQQLTQQSVE